LEADLGALELALLNLAVNARDAMPGGGALTIAAQNSPVDAALAARRSVPPGDYVKIAVVDTGSGMAPELLERVFEPFFTTKGTGRGTGLGLAQVYGFAQQSGGTAWVESRLGEGTQVCLLLPRSLRDAQPAPAGPIEVADRGARSNLRVLVVEDEPSVAAVVLDMLAELGHRGTCVATVASALAVLAQAGETDLVLSDVLLPGGDSGLDLAREVRQRRLGVPLVLTSGYGGSMTQRLSTMKLPFLRKPYRIDALRQAIDTAMQAEHLPALAGKG
jgi:CheY-like chemotaxis protein